MKAMLFDFGGTLDTNGIHWSEKFLEVYTYLQIPVTREQLTKAYIYAERNMNSVIKRTDYFTTTLRTKINFQLRYLTSNDIFSLSMSKSYAEQIYEVCYSDVIKNIEQTQIILRYLKPKFMLGVVSNYYGNLETVLKDLSIKDFFNVIIDSKIVSVTKPDPEIFQFAIEKLNISPEQTVVIGDSYDRDIEPAKKIGCKTVWLDVKSWQRPVDTSYADKIIHSLAELCRYSLDLI